MLLCALTMSGDRTLLENARTVRSPESLLIQGNPYSNPPPRQEDHRGETNSGTRQGYSNAPQGAAPQISSDASDQQKEGGRRRFKEVKDTPPSVYP